MIGAAVVAACALGCAPAARAATDEGIVRRMNEVREHRGIAPLRASVALQNAADQHCTEMVYAQVLTHGSPLGPLQDRLARYVSAARMGETLAWMPEAAPALVVRAWL